MYIVAITLKNDSSASPAEGRKEWYERWDDLEEAVQRYNELMGIYGDHIFTISLAEEIKGTDV
jgi:hypothetical protein